MDNFLSWTFSLYLKKTISQFDLEFFLSIHLGPFIQNLILYSFPFILKNNHKYFFWFYFFTLKSNQSIFLNLYNILKLLNINVLIKKDLLKNLNFFLLKDWEYCFIIILVNLFFNILQYFLIFFYVYLTVFPFIDYAKKNYIIKVFDLLLKHESSQLVRLRKSFKPKLF